MHAKLPIGVWAKIKIKTALQQKKKYVFIDISSTAIVPDCQVTGIKT